jgi:S1-C subfamily serine protease
MMKAVFTLAALAIAVASPLAPAIAQAASDSDDGLPSKQQGIGFAKDPSGAIITRVAKGSAAERAGVAEGMVITHIDGLPLRELSLPQIARLFAGSGDRLELKIRGSGAVTVGGTKSLSEGGSGFRVGPPGF